MTDDARVLIAGAGPVGLVAAAMLLRRGIPVTVLEAGPALSRESRASTFHPPTLDILDDLGVAEEFIAGGLQAPTLQYRTRQGLIAQFDFAAIADVTRHPYRLQSEQSQLTRLLQRRLADDANFRLLFDSRVEGVAQDAAGVSVTLSGRSAPLRGGWLIGADGASSAVRKGCGIGFEGFTWPERFLVVSTPFDFHAALPGLSSVSYVADPEQWHFLLEIPGLWRLMFPVPAEVDDAAATSPAYIDAAMARVVPGRRGYAVAHVTLYKVHQRVAESYRQGRVLLAGDAAHVNNPLGGMGMNGGIHDAVNLAERLARVWHGEAGEAALDSYDRQRRLVALEFVQRQSIQNKANLEARDPAAHAEFQRRLKETAADRDKAYQYLLNVSMIASLRRAAELG